MENQLLLDRLIQSLREKAGFSTEQIFQYLMERERTKQIEIQLEREKRKFSVSNNKGDDDKQIIINENNNNIIKYNDDEDEGIIPTTERERKKVKLSTMRTTEILCNDVIVLVLEFLPDLEGFKLMLVSKQFLSAASLLKKLKIVHLKTISTLKKFINSQFFNNLESFDALPLNLNINDILSKAKKLKTIILRSIGDSKMEDLQNQDLMNLERLTLEGVIEDISLEQFFYCNLTALYLKGSFENISRVVNNYTYNLKILEFSTIKDTDLALVSKLPVMEEFSSKVSISNDFSIFDIFKCKTLVKVKLMDVPKHSVTSGKSIDMECPNLKILSFRTFNCLDDTICCFKMPKLQELILETVGEKGINSLIENSTLSSLTYLHIADPIDEKWFNVIKSRYISSLKHYSVLYQKENESTTDVLIDLCNPSFSNINILKIERKKSNLNGYSIFSNCEIFQNLSTLTLGLPSTISDLLHLAKSTVFKKLTTLSISNTLQLESDCLEPKFIPTLSENETFKNLISLTYYLSDDDITALTCKTSILLNLKSIGIKGKLITAPGFKLLVSQKTISWSLEK